jgi:hypothetical protein
MNLPRWRGPEKKNKPPQSPDKQQSKAAVTETNVMGQDRRLQACMERGLIETGPASRGKNKTADTCCN